MKTTKIKLNGLQIIELYDHTSFDTELVVSELTQDDTFEVDFNQEKIYDEKSGYTYKCSYNEDALEFLGLELIDYSENE